jgi:alpha-tubulin suppressor-like RCC1 family protein
MLNISAGQASHRKWLRRARASPEMVPCSGLKWLASARCKKSLANSLMVTRRNNMVRYLITAFMALALLIPAGAQAAFVNYSTSANGTLDLPATQTVATGQLTAPVTATADPGFHFYNWTWTNPADAGNPFGTTDNPLSFTVTGTQPITARATFAGNLSQGVLVHGLSNIVDIKGGRSHTLALTSNGTVLAWGSNDQNQTGINKTTGVKAIAEGPYYSLALLNSGSLAASGIWSNASGTVIGPVTTALAETAATNHQGIKALAGGMGHSLALMNDGSVFAWGDNSLGQTTLPAYLNGKQIVAIAAGHEHSVALTSTGDIITWGGTSSAVLGLGLPNAACTESAPSSNFYTSCIITGVGATDIEAKGFHTVALTGDGKVFCFGANELGQGDVPANLAVGSSGTSNTDKATAVAAGAHHTTVLLANGTVLTWGDNTYGERVTPAGLTGITRIAAGSYHNLALQGNTAVVAWGDDQGNQCELPDLFAFNTPTDPQPDFNPLANGNSVVCTATDGSGRTTAAPYNGSSACAVTASQGYSLLSFIVNGIPKLVQSNSVTLSNVTAQQSITAVFATKPAAPTSVVAVAGDTLATVSFIAPNDGGSAINGYTVTSNPSGLTGTGSTSPITVNGLTNGTSYTFTVTATNGQGTGPATASNSVTPNAAALVTLANLTQTYTGSPLSPTATTIPPGLAVTWTGAPQTNAGSYPVIATINNPAFSGSQAGTFTISQVAQSITFDALSGRTVGAGGFTLTATSSSGLPVSFSSSTRNVCSVTGNAVTINGVGPCTIDAVQAGDTNYAAANTVSRSFLVTAGILDHFVVNAPANVTAGTPFSVTISALDSGNFPVTTLSETVTLTTTAGTIPPTSVDIVNGTGTASITLTGAGTGKTITVTDAASKTGSATLDVAPAAAETFSVVVPGAADAGAAFDFTVTAQDHYNNTVTNYAGTLHFTSIDGSAFLPADYSFVAGDKGTHTFSATLSTAGTQTITVTDSSTSAITGVSNSVGVTPAAPKFVVTADATATAGTAFPVTVAVKDNFGNIISDYTGTVHFTSSDNQAVLPADYPFTVADGGSHTFNDVILKSAASQTVTVTDTVTAATTGTSGSVMVAPTAPVALAFGHQPVSTAAGQPITPVVTVKVVDLFGNVVTSSNASITVAVATNPGSATLSGTATQTAQAGVATFADLSLNRNATGYTLSAASDSLTVATSNAFDVSAGALAHFSIATVGTQTLGVAFPIIVTAQDASGNTVSSFTGTVDLTGNGATVTPATSGNFVNGAWSGNVSVPTNSTSMTITAKATGGTETGTSNAFDVIKGSQTITTSDLPLVVPFQGTFDVTATSSASLPVTITGSGACSGSGTGNATLTIGSGSGTCTILFDQAGDASFDAVQLVAHVNAGQIQQAITVDTPAPTSATFGTNFVVAAHAPGGTVTYSSSGGCTNNGATFTMTSATLACTVTYSQAGSTVYFPAQTTQTTGAAAALPGAPTIYSVKAASGQATMIFVPPTQTGGSPITSYTVTANPGNITATGTNSPITITGLANGTAYTFSVSANNVAGAGPAAVSDAMTPVANGDLNGDGVFDIRDAMLALRIATGLQSATPAMLAAGDVAPLVNGVPQPDGKIDVGDVIVLLRKAVGLVTF